MLTPRQAIGAGMRMARNSCSMLSRRRALPSELVPKVERWLREDVSVWRLANLRGVNSTRHCTPQFALPIRSQQVNPCYSGRERVPFDLHTSLQSPDETGRPQGPILELRGVGPESFQAFLAKHLVYRPDQSFKRARRCKHPKAPPHARNIVSLSSHSAGVMDFNPGNLVT